jgi:hypothetical protein
MNSYNCSKYSTALCKGLTCAPEVQEQTVDRSTRGAFESSIHVMVIAATVSADVTWPAAAAATMMPWLQDLGCLRHCLMIWC